MAETEEKMQVEISFSNDGAKVVVKKGAKEEQPTTSSTDSFAFGKVLVTCFQTLLTQALCALLQVIVLLLRKI